MSARRRPLSLFDTPARLSALGLRLADFQWAMGRILEAGRGQSVHALSSKAGTDRYHIAVIAIREGHVPNGFAPSDDDNIGRIVAPNSAFQIVVGQGNVDTCTEEMPRTRRSRGKKGQALIGPNLFSDAVWQAIAKQAVTNAIVTRVFLYYATQNMVRAELSIPVGLDEKNRYSGFEDRIPLGEITENDLTMTGNLSPIAAPDPIDVTVKRRPTL